MRRRDLLALAGASVLAAPRGRAQILHGRGRPNVANTLNLICHGDSITLGVGVTTAYGALLSARLNTSNDQPNTLTSVGWNGQGYNYVYPSSGSPNDLIDDLPVSILPALSGSLPNWLVTFAGTNDLVLGGSSVADLEGYFQGYLSAAVAGGIPIGNIVAVCMLPRQSYSETNRGNWNAYLVAQGASQGFKVARVDLDPCIGLAGQQNNATYFQGDTIHPTEAGQAIIAEILAPLISPGL